MIVNTTNELPGYPFLCEFISIYNVESYLYVIRIAELGIEFVIYMTETKWK